MNGVIRLALNYKRIPYRTVWVEYADIQRVCQTIGAVPTGKRPNGDARYTLPTIVVPGSGEVLSDSAKIVSYLEQRYPERPLFPVNDAKPDQIECEAQLRSIIGMVRPG
jgi:glutathione S-transferase